MYPLHLMKNMSKLHFLNIKIFIYYLIASMFYLHKAVSRPDL